MFTSSVCTRLQISTLTLKAGSRRPMRSVSSGISRGPFGNEGPVGGDASRDGDEAALRVNMEYTSMRK